jgi:Ni,Fe-hydrogenase III large subunit
MKIVIAAENGGDVYARFRVRVNEVYAAIELIRQALDGLPAAGGGEKEPVTLFRRESFALGVVEGWRGGIVYMVATDAAGAVSRVDVRDPSFLTWTALGYAGQENMVPDFPLINKSFNLSYSGNDL